MDDPKPPDDNRSERSGPDAPLRLVGRSSAFLHVRQLLGYAAKADIPVLISGPAGVGKTSAAIALRSLESGRRPRSSRLFCSALDPAGLDAAIAPRPASLLLEEISDLTPALQARLLRHMETISQARLQSQMRAARPRTIATTRHDHRRLTQDLEFREDLYFRLSAFPIVLSPLAARPEDIAPLVAFFSKQAGAPTRPVFRPDALKLLLSQPWPGNARQLRNFVRRAAILHPGMAISASMANDMLANMKDMIASPLGPPDRPKDIPDGFDLRNYLREEEHRLLLAALRQSDGVVTEAAERLGLRRTTFVEKMKRYGIARSGDGAG